MSSQRQGYDAVVVGGGHNALVAAAYLARAGLSVLVLERLGHTGGATVSHQPFAGHPARFSRCADLVPFLPPRIVDDLGLDLTLAPRPAASYTPTLRAGAAAGLLVEQPESEATAASFRTLTGDDDEYAAWQAFHAEVAGFAERVTATLLDPLPVERTLRADTDPQLWEDLVMRPIGATIERRFSDDTVRGLLAARTLGGTSTSLHAPSLVQNRTFLHHHLGHGPDGWHVPVGGAGAVGDALAKAATGAGAELLTGAGVSRVAAGDDHAEVTWHDSHGTHTVTARHVLSDVAPWVLRILMGDGEDPEAKPEGAQLRIAMLLERLPRLRSGVDTAVAFGGTLRVATGLDHLERAHADAAAGRVPEPVPAEVHCHSLTDASVLGEDAPEGRHTLALVAHHLPASLFDHEREARASEAVERVLAALDEHLEEPLRSCLATDDHGEPCLQVTLPQDLEADLAMPGGHPFHGDLEWPWASNRARLETPAQRWGVQTDAEPVVVCGSGARRGGGVSGIGGHNAARAVLESR